jgi:hypothetical protein
MTIEGLNFWRVLPISYRNLLVAEREKRGVSQRKIVCEGSSVNWISKFDFEDWRMHGRTSSVRSV